MNRKKSAVWNIFQKENENEAKCSKCGAILKCVGGSTSALSQHLKIKHNIDTKTNYDEPPEKISKSVVAFSNTSSMLSFIQRESLAELLSKCAAYDGFSIYALTHSSAIREFITKRGYEMPKSENTVRTLIINFSNDKKINIKENLRKLTESGTRFSITIDEWTSYNAQRYLNVTLHTVVDSYKLGLIKINTSCDAYQLQELVEQKLSEYDITLKRHVLASTQDGASIMKKYSRLNGLENQLCLNHAIHLGVLDTFYKKCDSNKLVQDTSDEESMDVDEENEDHFDVLIDDNNLKVEYVTGNKNEFSLEVEDSDIKEILRNLRNLVKFFRKSAVRNSILQRYVQEKESKTLFLLLDCKTRWNSLIPMIERLIRIKDCIKKR